MIEGGEVNDPKKAGDTRWCRVHYREEPTWTCPICGKTILAENEANHRESIGHTPASSDVAERLRALEWGMTNAELREVGNAAADMIERLERERAEAVAITDHECAESHMEAVRLAEAERDAAIEHLRDLADDARAVLSDGPYEGDTPAAQVHRTMVLQDNLEASHSSARAFLNSRDSGGGQG